MTKYIVHGGKPLFGEVEISGAKNAAVAIIPAAILVDGETGTVLYDKNMHEELPMASITKVMSALLVLEAVDRGQLRMDQGITATESAMKGMLAPKFQEQIIGHVEIRQTFKVSNVGTVAGCYVTDGKIQRSCEARIVRDGIVIHEGHLASLQRFKDSVKEVAAEAKEDAPAVA